VVSSKSQITSKILFFLGSTNKVNRAVRFSIACGSVQLAKGIPPYTYLIILQLTLNYNNLNNLPRAVFLKKQKATKRGQTKRTKRKFKKGSSH
jgi:hypothetical protein